MGVVGAGVAAAPATHHLAERRDVELTVLEAADAVGGRTATRRRREVVPDDSANSVKSDDWRVVNLLTGTLTTDGHVDLAVPVYTLDDAGKVTPGPDEDDRVS